PSHGEPWAPGGTVGNQCCESGLFSFGASCSGFLPPKIPKILCRIPDFFSSSSDAAGAEVVPATGGVGRGPTATPGGGASSDLVLSAPKMRESHEDGVCVSMRPPCSSQNSAGSVPERKTSLRVVGQAGVASSRVVGSISTTLTPAGGTKPVNSL